MQTRGRAPLLGISDGRFFHSALKFPALTGNQFHFPAGSAEHERSWPETSRLWPADGRCILPPDNVAKSCTFSHMKATIRGPGYPCRCHTDETLSDMLLCLFSWWWTWLPLLQPSGLQLSTSSGCASLFTLLSEDTERRWIQCIRLLKVCFSLDGIISVGFVFSAAALLYGSRYSVNFILLLSCWLLISCEFPGRLCGSCGCTLTAPADVRGE